MNDNVHTKGRPRAPLAHPDRPSLADTTSVPRIDSLPESPGVEPWAKLLLTALVPAIVALWMPHALKLVLFAITGVLFATGLVLLVRQERDRPAPRRD